MAGPQTTREALIAELLGDLGALLDRAESLQKALPDVADVAATQIHLAGEGVATGIEAQARQHLQQLGELLGRERAALVDPISAASQATRAAADTLRDASHRITAKVVLLGMAAGALAGGVVGAAVAALLLA